MVRLNSNQLTTQQHEQLWLQLAKIIAPQNSTRAGNLLKEILGYEERIMIAKRLAVVVLSVEGISPYRIANELKLSQATIHSIREKIDKGGYATVLKSVSKTKKDYFAFLNTLDTILHLGGILPHYNGLDRYPSLLHRNQR